MPQVFEQMVNGQKCQMTMTALVGHLMEVKFPKSFENWQTVPFVQLFEAPIDKKVKDDMNQIAENLKRVGRQAQMLVIWTDNDREGENIGSEVAQLVRTVNPRIIVKRARFSVVQGRHVFVINRSRN
jgi:DNA topoisomerase-3